MKRIIPNLVTDDCLKQVNFYIDVLGFKFVMGVVAGTHDVVVTLADDQPLDFALLACGDVDVMLTSRKSFQQDFPKSHLEKLPDNISLYIEVDDISAFYALLKDQAMIIKPLHTTFYGMREFYLRDADGYLLGFAEQVKAKA